MHPAARYAIFKTQKESNRPQGVDLKGKLEIHRIATPLLAKVKEGGFFYARKTLSDKRKNECQQCKNEHAKSHKVFEIKMIIVHQHHPHSM